MLTSEHDQEGLLDHIRLPGIQVKAHATVATSIVSLPTAFTPVPVGRDPPALGSSLGVELGIHSWIGSA
jgi:hypothetical protein